MSALISWVLPAAIQPGGKRQGGSVDSIRGGSRLVKPAGLTIVADTQVVAAFATALDVPLARCQTQPLQIVICVVAVVAATLSGR